MSTIQNTKFYLTLDDILFLFFCVFFIDGYSILAITIGILLLKNQIKSKKKAKRISKNKLNKLRYKKIKL